MSLDDPLNQQSNNNQPNEPVTGLPGNQNQSVTGIADDDNVPLNTPSPRGLFKPSSEKGFSITSINPDILKPEKPDTTLEKTQEKVSQEVFKAPEKLKPIEKLPEKKAGEKETPQDQEAPLPKTKPVAKPNVIDKTEVATKLHTIEKAKDKLTALADQEEEEFIKNVEAAHGHK